MNNPLSEYISAVNTASAILQRENNMSCRFIVMNDAMLPPPETRDYIRDNHGNALFANCWYVVVSCANGHKYYINVTFDSVLTMLSELFDFVSYK